MTTTLVTGATGFIGRKLALHLLERGELLRVFCRTPSRLDPRLREAAGVEIAVGDMEDAAALERAVRGAARVVHLAAATSGSWDDFQRATVVGTRLILDAAGAAGVRRFVYVSSMSVYDYSQVPDGGVVDEHAPLETKRELRGNYARAKGEAELIALDYMQRGALPMCVVRPGFVYGTGGIPPFLSTVLSLRGKCFFLIGGGRRQIPFVYLENLVDALLFLLESDAVLGRVFNVVDPDPPSERRYLETLHAIQHTSAPFVPLPRWPFLLAAQLVQRLRDLSGRPGERHLVRGFRRAAAQIRFDPGTLLREVGWTPRVSFAEGMRATCATVPRGA